MSAFALTLMALLCALPLLIFVACLYLCVQRRDFLGKPGSLACFMLLMFISYYAFEHWSSPYPYIVTGLLGACYLWLFFIRPFRA